MTTFCSVFVLLTVLMGPGTGFELSAGDGERLQRLQIEVEIFKQDLVKDSLEIHAWNIKLEKLKESILDLKKEKEKGKP